MNEILLKIDVLLLNQRELLRMMKALEAVRVLPDKLDKDEVLLKKDAVMDLLCITESTFYRRLAEAKWIRKKSGRSWYYLKSSLFT